MKILTTILTLIPILVLAPFQHGVSASGDSIKTEIEDFERKVFALPIDEEIDTSAIYTSVFVYTRTSKYKKNGGPRLRSDHSYLRNENDSILCRELVKEDVDWIIKNSVIVSEGKIFEDLKNHALNGVYGRCIVGFDKKYLVIRSSQIMMNTNSRNTAPSEFIEKYVYYERKN